MSAWNYKTCKLSISFLGVTFEILKYEKILNYFTNSALLCCLSDNDLVFVLVGLFIPGLWINIFATFYHRKPPGGPGKA